MDFSRLPKETVWNIMSNMSFPELSTQCQGQPEIKKQCQNIEFWLYLFRTKQIDTSGLRSVKEYREAYGIWSRVSEFVAFDINPLPKKNKHLFQTHDFLGTSDGSCISGVSDVKTRIFPDRKTFYIHLRNRDGVWTNRGWDEGETSQIINDTFIRLDRTAADLGGIVVRIRDSYGEIPMTLFAGVTYWVTYIVQYSNIITLRISKSFEEAFEMLEADIDEDSIMANVIDDNSHNIKEIQNFMKRINAPMPINIDDYDQSMEYSETLKDWLLSNEDIWKKGFIMNKLIGQIGCFNFN